MYTTYSFLDLQGALTHPTAGSYNFNGEGIGDLSIEMLTDKTAHHVAADGPVMVSKIAGDNGHVTLNIQQTADLHHWLLNAYNASKEGDTADWAGIAAKFWNVVDGSMHTCRGGSFDKLGTKAYQKEGQMVVWKLWFADIQNESV